MSLESENDIVNKVKNFDPQQIMEINQTDALQDFGIRQNNINTGAVFDIKIFQPNSDNPIWRGSLRTRSGLGLSIAANSAHKKLISRLPKDKLLN